MEDMSYPPPEQTHILKMVVRPFWINCLDRMPEQCPDTIVMATDGEKIFFGTYCWWVSMNKGHDDWNFEHNCGSITHWMPLPNLPEKDDNSK